MKNLLFVLIMLSFFVSCSKSQEESSVNWASVQYFYSRGSLPPPYHYNFSITVNNDGTSALNYNLGYGENPPLNYAFTVKPEDLKLLSNKINASPLASEKTESLSEKDNPVGGPTDYIRIIITNSNPDLDQPPKVIQSPVFPKEEFKKDLNDLYEFVKKLVPSDVWLDVNGKQTEYETNFKK